EFSSEGRRLQDVRVRELAPQEVADPASDQIRTGSARPRAGDAEPECDHGHDVHGDGGKDTHNQAAYERAAFHRTAPPPLLVRLPFIRQRQQPTYRGTAPSPFWTSPSADRPSSHIP